jgi:hypothetical protein
MKSVDYVYSRSSPLESQKQNDLDVFVDYGGICFFRW